MSLLQRFQRKYRALIGAAVSTGSPELKPPAVEPPRLREGQIDVRSLIARYDATKHAELADAYFEPLLNNPVIRRKPFAHVPDAIQIMGGFTHVLEGLRLFPQATVLDFGAGTCWSSRILASLGCRVTALDVSKNALQIGRSLHEQDPITKTLPIDFKVFDGRSIPTDNACFDRILSFDAFHHVADQQAVLSEFSRVLSDDGIAGFAEPGPDHSLTATSQMEMRDYNVIENDIRIEEIWKLAEACGFADIKLSFAMPRQELLTLEDFNRILDARSAPDHVVFSAANAAIHQNRRVFFLYKSSEAEKDSRFPEGLRGRLQVLDVTPQDADSVRLGLAIENSGASTWRPSGSGPGCVNIGVHVRAADGHMLDSDFRRLSISQDRVRPGVRLEVSESLRLPELEDFGLELDLVAENVTWFELAGSTPLKLAFRNRRYVAHQ